MVAGALDPLKFRRMAYIVELIKAELRKLKRFVRYHPPSVSVPASQDLME